MSKTATRLGEINLVTVPVIDQDLSIEFYVDKLGFEKRTDVEFGGGKYRFREVAKGIGVALGAEG